MVKRRNARCLPGSTTNHTHATKHWLTSLKSRVRIEPKYEISTRKSNSSGSLLALTPVRDSFCSSSVLYSSSFLIYIHAEVVCMPLTRRGVCFALQIGQQIFVAINLPYSTHSARSRSTNNSAGVQTAQSTRSHPENIPFSPS